MKRSGPWHIGLALILASLAPGSARAILTSRVDGLEASLNAAWSQTPGCQDVLVDDLLVRDRAFALTTTSPVIYRIGHEERGRTLCTAAEWRISASDNADPRATACAPALCDLLSRQGLAPKLEQALELSRTQQTEALIPVSWSPPSLQPIAMVWFACCVLTLALLATLPLLRRVRRVPAVPSGFTRNDWLFISAAALFGLFHRLWLAQHAPFELDETVSIGYDSLWREFDGRETVMNPPIYRVISYPVTAMTGGAMQPGRYVAVALGFLLIFAMARLADIVAGRLAGLAAAVLAAVHPALTMATVYHRGYAPEVVAAALMLFATARAIRTEQPIDRYFTAACMAAAVLSHYFGIAIVAGAALWIGFGDRGRWKAWLGPAALVVMLCAPFVPAVLSGGHAKANSAIGTSGLSHALGLALSLPAFVSGLVKPNLEGVLYTLHSTSELALDSLFLAVAMFFGARQLPGPARLGLVSATLFATFLPVPLATRLTTIRDFQGVAGAVPAVILFSAVIRQARQPSMRAVAAAGVLALAISYLIPFHAQPRTLREVEVAAQAIRADQSHWPIFVWHSEVPDFSDVALQVGLTRMEADASADGRDQRVRALRSCSTAAVRDAAAQTGHHVVRVMTIADPCQPADLSGRGVSCGLRQELTAGVGVTTCEVAADVRDRPVPLPRRLPAGISRRADRAIPPGHDKLFTDAVLPRRMGQPDDHGVVLSGIGINIEHVKYDLSTPAGPAATVYVAPRFSGEAIDGTSIAIDPPEQTLPEAVRQSASELSRSFESRITPVVWDSVYGLVTNGEGGHTAIRPAPWLILAAIAAAVLLDQLRRSFAKLA